jgi:hypothetical protein
MGEFEPSSCEIQLKGDDDRVDANISTVMKDLDNPAEDDKEVEFVYSIEERQNEDTAYKVERYDPTLLESSVSERRASAISTKPINRDSSAKERRDIAGQDLLQTKVPGRL